MSKKLVSPIELLSYIHSLEAEKAADEAYNNLLAAEERGDALLGLLMADLLRQSDSCSKKEDVPKHLVWLLQSDDPSNQERAFETFRQYLMGDQDVGVRLHAGEALTDFMSLLNPAVLSFPKNYEQRGKDEFGDLSLTALQLPKGKFDHGASRFSLGGFVSEVVDGFLGDDDYRISSFGVRLAYDAIRLPQEVITSEDFSKLKDLVVSALDHSHPATRVQASQVVFNSHYNYLRHGKRVTYFDVAAMNEHIETFLAEDQPEIVRQSMLYNVFGTLNGGGYASVNPKWCIKLASKMFDEKSPAFDTVVIPAFPNIQTYDQSGELEALACRIAENGTGKQKLALCRLLFDAPDRFGKSMEAVNKGVTLKIYRALKQHGGPKVQEFLKPYSVLVLTFGASVMENAAKVEKLPKSVSEFMERARSNFGEMAGVAAANQNTPEYYLVREHAWRLVLEQGAGVLGAVVEHGADVSERFWECVVLKRLEEFSDEPLKLCKAMEEIQAYEGVPKHVTRWIAEIEDGDLVKVKERAAASLSQQPSPRRKILKAYRASADQALIISTPAAFGG